MQIEPSGIFSLGEDFQQLKTNICSLRLTLDSRLQEIDRLRKSAIGDVYIHLAEDIAGLRRYILILLDHVRQFIQVFYIVRRWLDGDRGFFLFGRNLNRFFLF